MAQRMMAMVNAAMFDAVNSIEPAYRRYLVQLPAPATTSKKGVAAAAAAVLTTVDAKTANDVKIALTTYLASTSGGAAKADGVKLREAVAAKVLQAHHGWKAPDAYRPRATPACMCRRRSRSPRCGLTRSHSPWPTHPNSGSDTVIQPVSPSDQPRCSRLLLAMATFPYLPLGSRIVRPPETWSSRPLRGCQ